MLYILVLGFGVAIVGGQVSVSDQIIDAYLALAEASHVGGDVSSLVDELNSIIMVVDLGDYNVVEVSGALNDIMAEANLLAEAAESENTLGLVLTCANLVVVLVLGYFVWRYFPSYYWRIWLRLRGDWIVE
jgi:hypothetical protein